jgi:hypothetical protein
MALADSLYALSKSGALEALSKDLPRANKIEPVYVHAGLGESATSFFDDSRIRLRVLAPMEDIDHYYLGKTPAALKGLAMVKASAPPDHAAAADGGGAGEPVNISSEDFARLKARLLNNALALALIDGHVVNNTSVVLLLEWRGRRLLFTGDAEVKLAREGGFDEGVSNGSWNVMWAKQKEALSGPLDFLKVGHHGSSNATPWTAQTIAVPRGGGQKPHPVNAVLDAILPVPNDGRTPAAAAAVSTHRTKSWKGIPDPLLMAELGRRVANVKRYDEAVFYAKEGRLDTEPYQVAPTTPQPQRTDLEGGHHIDFRFPAKGRRPPARRTKAVRQ